MRATLAVSSSARRWSVAMVVAAAVAACHDGAHRPGGERQPCGRDQSCQPGLACWSEICVRAPTDCVEVARRLARYRLGDDASGDQLAASGAAIYDACQRQRLTARDGACLIAARDEDELLACPHLLLDDLEDRRQARLHPDAGVDATVDGGLAPVSTAGLTPSCVRYVELMNSMMSCQALPLASRTGIRDALDQLVPQLRSGNARMFEQACRQGSDGLAQALAAVGCPLP